MSASGGMLGKMGYGNYMLVGVEQLVDRNTCVESEGRND